MVTSETVYVVYNIRIGKYLSNEYDHTDNIEEAVTFKLLTMARDTCIPHEDVVLSVQRTWAVNVLETSNANS